jgi:hypothetical protein
MKDYYVTLTGGKNNAGDFLIKYRGFDLLRWLRPDREVVDYNAWEEITEEKLKVINGAKALIFLGGPALRKDMFSKIYNIKDLSAIKVPVVSFAIGWKSNSGDWSDSRSYPLHPDTLSLVTKAGEAGLHWGVRDYASLNAITTKGVDGALMTGCAALYAKDYLNSAMRLVNHGDIRKVSFSLGVGFRNDKKLDRQQREIILALKNFFPNAEYTVVFNHGITETYAKSDGANLKMLKDHQKLAEWLTREGIKYMDISGSAESLIKHYSDCDLHVGYRVHAHIFMSSISRLSVLINEDGRGKALAHVVPGLYFDAFDRILPMASTLERIKNKLRGKPSSRFVVYEKLPSELITNLKYEFDNGFPRLGRTRSSIDHLFPVMEKFIKELP